MNTLCRWIDRISGVLTRVAEIVTLALVAAMIYEVGARYLFDAPTIWAFDIAYMCTGTLFVLGAAHALKEDAHIRIDFLAQRLPVRWRRRIEAVVFLLLTTPLFASLTWFAVERAISAWRTSEVEMVSPWAPLMWPFYALLALGLAALTLQLFAQGLRAARGHTFNSFEIET